MVLIWHEEENVAREYFMAGMKANSIFRYEDNRIEIIFLHDIRLIKIL